MAIDQLTIWNLALSACGTRSTVASPTETTREARLCNQWYDDVRQLILQTAPWNSARKYSRLALIVERDDTLDWASTDPEPGFQYAYGQPSDLLRPRSTTTFAEFKPGIYGTSTKAIFTNEESPILQYTFDQQRVDLWEPGLRDAMAFALAAHIVTALTGQRTKLSDLVSQAQAKIMQARVDGANSQNPTMLETIPDWIAARGYSNNNPSSRYVFPPAEFNVASIGLVR